MGCWVSPRRPTKSRDIERQQGPVSGPFREHARFVRDYLFERLDVPGRALFDQAVPKGKFWRDVSALTQQAALSIVVAAAAGDATPEELAAMGKPFGVQATDGRATRSRSERSQA